MDGPPALPPGTDADPDARELRWRTPPAALTLRAVTFLAVAATSGVALERSADRPLWLLVIAVAGTAASALWLVRGLREGWEITTHGVVLDVGARRPTRLPWASIRRLLVSPAPTRRGRRWVIQVDTTDGRRYPLGPPSTSPQRHDATLHAAQDLQLVPADVTLQDSSHER